MEDGEGSCCSTLGWITWTVLFGTLVGISVQTDDWMMIGVFFVGVDSGKPSANFFFLADVLHGKRLNW